VAVEHELTCSGASGSDAKTINYVIEARFEELEQNFTGDTFEARCFLEEVAELFFENAIGVFCFLLFTKLNAVLRGFATFVLSVLAGGEVSSFENFVGAENGFAELAGDFGLGTCVSSPCVK
jgi:hypothetical protein